LSLQIAASDSFSNRYFIFRRIRAGLKSEASWKELDDHFFQRWVRRQTCEALSSMAMTSVEDGFILADMAAEHHSSWNIFKQYVVSSTAVPTTNKI
jgi:hypothetical protein